MVEALEEKATAKSNVAYEPTLRATAVPYPQRSGTLCPTMRKPVLVVLKCTAKQLVEVRRYPPRLRNILLSSSSQERLPPMIDLVWCEMVLFERRALRSSTSIDPTRGGGLFYKMVARYTTPIVPFAAASRQAGTISRKHFKQTFRDCSED